MRLDYPIELARRVVQVTEKATPLALDSHGIGMEQKLSDIAGCLADVLRVSSGDTSDTFVFGRRYLHLMLNKVCPSPLPLRIRGCVLTFLQMSKMRGRESRYLRPLVARAGDVLDSSVPRTMALPPATVGKVEAEENDKIPQTLQWA